MSLSAGTAVSGGSRHGKDWECAHSNGEDRSPRLPTQCINSDTGHCSWLNAHIKRARTDRHLAVIAIRHVTHPPPSPTRLITRLPAEAYYNAVVNTELRRNLVGLTVISLTAGGLYQGIKCGNEAVAKTLALGAGGVVSPPDGTRCPGPRHLSCRIACHGMRRPDDRRVWRHVGQAERVGFRKINKQINMLETSIARVNASGRNDNTSKSIGSITATADNITKHAKALLPGLLAQLAGAGTGHHCHSRSPGSRRGQAQLVHRTPSLQAIFGHVADLPGFQVLFPRP